MTGKRICLVQLTTHSFHIFFVWAFSVFKQLGTWVSTQRQAKKGTVRNKISDEQIKKLDDIGFVWNLDVDKWDLRFEELKAYKATHGHCNVPCRYQKNPVSCVGWVVGQLVIFFMLLLLLLDSFSRTHNSFFLYLLCFVPSLHSRNLEHGSKCREKLRKDEETIGSLKNGSRS